MKVLIKQAHIVCESSTHHGQIADILIEDGTIRQISQDIGKEADVIMDGPDLHVSSGWVDVFADLGEPGFEHRETLQTGAAAAAAGGYRYLPDAKHKSGTRIEVAN